MDHLLHGFRSYVTLVRERPDKLGEPYTIKSPQDVYDAFRPLETADREKFYALYLGAHHDVIGVELISQGTLNESVVHPREVYKGAIAAGAAAIMVVHNHPSGDPTPSADDRSITERLRAAGRILGIPLYDHVIVGSDKYVSFLAEGLL